MMCLKPSKGYVFIQEEKLPELTEGGIVLPEKSRNTGVFGIIISVNNEGTWFSRFLGKGTNYRKGQKVIYDQYMAHDTFITDEKGKRIKDIWILPTHGIFAIRA